MRPTHRPTPTGAPGTWPRRRPAPTRMSRQMERAAGRAQARGGLAAAAAFLERAVALTPAPWRRAQRALAAAQTKFEAGALDDALALLGTAESGGVDDLQRARVGLLRAQIAFAARRGGGAPRLLLGAPPRARAGRAGPGRPPHL